MHERRFDALAGARSPQGARRGLLAGLAVALGPPEQVGRRGTGCDGLVL